MRSVFFSHLVNGAFGDPALYVRLAHRRRALLFDCGDLHALSPGEMLKIREIFVSHAHIDHLIGFEQLLRGFLYLDEHLTLYGPPGIAERIAARLAGYTWNLIGGYPLALTVREWPGREVTFRADQSFRPGRKREWHDGQGPLLESPTCRVMATSLDHGGIISLAYALEEPLHVAIHKDALDAEGFRAGPWLTHFKDLLRRQVTPDTSLAVPLVAGGEKIVPVGELTSRIAHLERGMKLTYVTDADPSESNLKKIVDLAADSHLLAIEATFAHAELERARQRGHLTAHLAGSIARQARVSRLLVFHHSPRYQDRPGMLAAEAEAAFVGADSE